MMIEYGKINETIVRPICVEVIAIGIVPIYELSLKRFKVDEGICRWFCV
jgi:hypothetical protein